MVQALIDFPISVAPPPTEIQIFDRAWGLIVDRHPELDTSPADEARAAADIDLKRSCLPSIRLQRPHPPLLLRRGRGIGVAALSPEESAGETGQAGAGAAESKEDGNDGGTVGDDEAVATEGFGGGLEGISLLQWDHRGEVSCRIKGFS